MSAWWGKQASWLAVAKRHGKPVTRTIARLARGYLNAYENVGSYQLDSDGERRVLEKLATLRPAIVFDVGANVGEWSLLAAECLPTVEIHAFEVAPSVADVLAERVRHHARIHANGFGLSDRSEEVLVHVAQFSPISSFVVEVPGTVERGTVRKGATYAADAGISHIDFLKIDTEGADHLVLAGFAEMLRQGRIDIVQFEYGPFALETRFLLADFFARLEGYGFSVGKVYPRYVEFRRYRVEDEDFRGLNYLAVQSRRSDIIYLLSRR